MVKDDSEALVEGNPERPLVEDSEDSKAENNSTGRTTLGRKWSVKERSCAMRWLL